MAMGKRKPRQESLFITTDQLTPSAGHPFYQRLNALLAENGFDDWIQRRCAEFYEREEARGRLSLPPGVYFRMLLVGYFEGLDSQRGIAWRCSDSLSLRAFLGIPLDQATPDHSTLTNTRKRLPEEVFDEVFRFVLGIAEANKLIAGTTVCVDSTLLEANAAMKSIVRRDTGGNWKQYVTKLMREAGEIGPDEEPSNEAARRFDKKRKGKKVSNEDWKSSTDADARIAHMKDGTTHLAYKAEHVVDLESDLVLAAEIRLATDGDAATMADNPPSARRAKVDGQFGREGVEVARAGVAAQEGNQILLACLAEHQAIGGERFPQVVQFFPVAAQRQRGYMSLDRRAAIFSEHPVRRQIGAPRRPHRVRRGEQRRPRAGDGSSECGGAVSSDKVLADGVVLVPVHPPLALLHVHRVGRQVPVDDRVAVVVEVQPLLADRGSRQHERPERGVERISDVVSGCGW